MIRVNSLPSALQALLRVAAASQRILLVLLALLMASVGQAQTIYVEPAFTYLFSQGVYFNNPSVDTTFAEVVAWDTGNTVSNLHPDDQPPLTFYDGVPSIYMMDVTTCYAWSGQCTTHHDGLNIYTQEVCPNGSGEARDFNSPSDTEIVACTVTLPSYPPPPTNCKSCIADPIFAVNGEALQVETDYAGASGLNFTRTYRSTNGYFASVVTQTFINNSTPAGTPSPGCYPHYYTYANNGTNQTAFYCFPYISTYTYVNGGVAQYEVQTDDGRMISFSGPNNATTQSADVNDRLNMLTVNGATEWQVRRDDDSVEIYNASGSLIQRTLRDGQTFTYTYSTTSTPTNIAPTPGLLLTQSDAFGHTLSWQYSAAGQMSQMTDPAGGIYQYSYDGNGNITGITYPDSSAKTYWYNESANTNGNNFPNALTGITDQNSVRFSTFQYNSASKAVTSELAGGVDQYTFSYSSSTTVTDPLGTIRTYQFQDTLSYGVDFSVTQPAASGSGTVSERWTPHDANGNISQQTDFNGNVTKYVYDLTRNLETSRTEAYGTAQARTITTVWDANWRQPDSITEPNRVTSFTYDSLGNVLTKTITDTTVTPNATRTWTYTYDSYGRMLTAQGPRTDVNSTTTYTYYTCTTGYQCGEVETITDALSHVWTFNTYNGHGQPLTIIDPNGVVTTLTYDARLRLTSRQIGSETTSYSYYPTGLLEQVTLPDGTTIQYTYDGAHRLTDITDGLGNHIHYTLDNMGNRTAENAYDPRGTLHRTHTRAFNALNELYQEINAAGTSAVTTTFSYDNDGNTTSAAAPLSRNTADQYDALNRLTKITDPNSGITQLGYDANDNLTSVKDPRSLTTSYTHNGFGDVTQLVSPDTGTTVNTYDSGGNLKTATDARSALATYSYDAMNRVTQVAYSDETINFAYDAGTNGVGRLTGASDANHSLSWVYDTLGRVTGKGLVVGSVNLSVGYGFTNGDLVSLVTPSGQTITYGYTDHQITSISVNGAALLTNAAYEPFGAVNGWTWGNATTVSRTYDTDEKITQISTAGDTVSFGYDNAFRITAITDTGNGANSWTLGYDPLDRLTSAVETATSLGWTYDANGNRLTQTGSNASTFTPASTSNRLNTVTGALSRTYGYDAEGNTTSYSSDSFSYNQRARMTSAATSGGTTNYIYSALGQMIEKNGASGTTYLMYDEAGHVIGEYSSGGALIEETVWMRDVPVATLQPNGSGGINIYYVHADQLNAPRVITQPSSNAIAWRWDTDPFGTVAANQNPSGLGTFIYNLRFPGQYYQVETGLNYNYFRDYDPQSGRYIESDPIGLGGGINTYAFVAGNPISRRDPFGLSSLIYNPGTGTITVFSGAGQAVGVFPAGNNAQSGSRGPWPAGNYSYAYHTTHPDDGPDSPYGSYGNWVFNVPGCVGCGVHSGRANSTDLAGRSGVRFATNGCIRTTDSATGRINALTLNGDPLTVLTVLSTSAPGNTAPVTTLPSVGP